MNKKKISAIIMFKNRIPFQLQTHESLLNLVNNQSQPTNTGTNQSESFTDYIHCLASAHVYYFDSDLLAKPPKKPTCCFSTPQPTAQEPHQANQDYSDEVGKLLNASGWFTSEKLKTIGFKSEINVNQSTRHILVAFQGLKFQLTDLFNSNYRAYINSLTGLLHAQIVCLYLHVRRSVELSKRTGYALSFAGYSFGAWYADLSVYFCHKYFGLTQVKAITFEGVGSLEFIQKLNAVTKTNRFECA